MKILYDYQIFEAQNIGGISRYFFELFNNFNFYKDIEYEIPIKNSSNIYLKQLDNIKDYIQPSFDSYDDFFWGLEFKGKKKIYRLMKKVFNKLKLNEKNKKLMISEIKKKNYDIFHPTYYNPYFLDYIDNKPFVLTVYDMIHELFPEYSPLKNNYLIKWKKELIEKSIKIISISENTKKDIIKFYNVAPDKIDVIHLGSSFNKNNDNIYSLSDLPEKYILFVGNRTIYKNFYFFLYSIIELFAKDKNLYLICVGDSFTKSEKIFFQRFSLDERIIHFSADDSTLSCLYNKALAFVFPSLYEGFGIPILEAFSCGCPVISSNKSSLPEIGGNACEYFEPKDPESILNAVNKVIYNKKLRQDLIKRGYGRVKLFSWEECARKTKKLYERILY